MHQKRFVLKMRQRLYNEVTKECFYVKSRVYRRMSCRYDAVKKRLCSKRRRAPCNVCACVARLGSDAAYLGKLGGDSYADFLYDQIKSAGIDTRFVVFDKSLKTALAFVDIDEKGDRKFRFERENTADLNLTADDVKDDFEAGDILHFCSLGLMGQSKLAHEKPLRLHGKAARSFLLTSMSGQTFGTVLTIA